jgi:hypothetical protein
MTDSAWIIESDIGMPRILISVYVQVCDGDTSSQIRVKILLYLINRFEGNE